MKRILLILFCGVTYSGVAAQDLSLGLVACYSFSGNTNDESGNGNNGVSRGAVPTKDRFGNPNSAYQFDGTESYISLPAGNFILPEFTYSAWFLVTSFPPLLGANGYVFSVGTGINDQALLITSDPGCPHPYCFSIGTEQYVNSSATEIEVGYAAAPVQQWFHLVFSVSGSFSHSWLNGVSFDSQNFYGTATPGYPSSPQAIIGARSDLTQFFNGIIDDISIYNRGLSDAEVALLYKRGYPCAPLPPVIPGDALCANSSTTLVAAGTGNYRWYGTPNGGTPLFEGNPFHTPDLTDTTWYYVSNVINSVESNRTKVTVIVNPSPSVSCKAPIDGLVDEPVYFTVAVTSGTPPFNYSISFGDGTSGNQSDQTATHKYNQSATYTFTAVVVDSNDCTGRCSSEVTLVTVVIPDVITVNGDSLNNRFTVFERTTSAPKPYSGSLPFSMLILNRWGDIVYTTTNALIGWNGENVPPGIYYYAITLGDQNFKGWVSVVK